MTKQICQSRLVTCMMAHVMLSPAFESKGKPASNNYLSYP